MLSRRAAASSDLALWMTHIIKLTPTIAYFSGVKITGLREGEKENKLHENLIERENKNKNVFNHLKYKHAITC